MEGAVITGLVSDVLQRLNSVAIKEFRLLRSYNYDVSILQDDFKKIQEVLNNQDLEKHAQQDRIVKSWLKDLRSESLKMENLLDEVSTEALLRKLNKELGTRYRLRGFFSSKNNVIFRSRVAHEIEAIQKKIADIAEKRYQLSFFTPGATIIQDLGGQGDMPNRETSSLILSSIIYGRNEEIEMVTRKICNANIGKHVNDEIPVFAIWGMGGLGKTTLAQLVYKHQRVDDYFQLKCWMHVSKNFNVKELIRGIIESIDKDKHIPSQLDELQKRLKKLLVGKRFLLVLDDVWIEESEKTKWEQLKMTLCCGTKSSMVMMTTPYKTTSQMMAKVPELQHELGCLSEEDSWSLFKKLAFAQGRGGGDRMELESIGKEIVKKCKGLPLAVKTLGGLMWSKSSKDEWEHVKGSNIWELEENDIKPALKLSYDNLPPHLKRCFAYCCLFPKGYEMRKTVLIDFWMTNGLIPARGEANWYVLGEEIINCLLWKSFFHVDKDDKYLDFVIYKIDERDKMDERYRMHDLMHDLAQHIMRDDCSVIEPGKELIIPNEVLHLSSSSPDFRFSTHLEKLTSLRSILIFSNEYKESISHIFKHMYLRVLSLDGISLSALPESIGKLKHLKYLNLSGSNIQVLPESIVYLQNLQVLLVKSCKRLRELPQRLKYMRNLQHLDNSGCDSLKHLPIGIKELTNLQRLSEFCVGENNGAQIGELQDLNLLRGDLILSQLHNVEGSEEARSANLKSKKEILHLTLSWYTWTRDEDINAPYVLEGLEPNQSLKYLQMEYYNGDIISPRWMVNLRNLAELRFYYCKECKYIPPLGKLPSLRVIALRSMDSLKDFHDDDNTMSPDRTLFPSLQVLFISSCKNLVSLPRNFPKLEELAIHSCKSLCSLPDEIQSFKDLKVVEIIECENISRRYYKDSDDDWSKISHIPHVTIQAPEE